MGSSSSKQLPTHTSPVRDSVVLCDGLKKMREVKDPWKAVEVTGNLGTHKPWYAGSNCGRFIYMLGHQIKKPSTDFDSVTTFDLDIVDLFLSKRTRIENIGDFFNYGFTTGFYYLSDQTVVIVDYDRNTATLRQRLIQIDISKETAMCHFYRGYSIVGLSGAYFLDFYVHARTSVGEDLAITVIPNRDMDIHGMQYTLSDEMAGIIYPLNPLSKRRSKRITDLIEEASQYVGDVYPANENGLATVFTIHPPFFLCQHEIGFFIDPRDNKSAIDPMTILVMNIKSGEMAIKEAWSILPFSASQKNPFYASWVQANYREVALTYRIERSAYCWQKIVHKLLQWSLSPLISIHNYLASTNHWKLRMGAYFFILINWIIRWQILQTQQTDLAILNTKNLEWTEIGASVKKGSYEYLKMIPLRDGHFILASQVNEISDSRLIGGKNVKGAKEKFRLIRSPYSLSSLSHLASIAVQKIDQVPQELIEQLATRFMS